MSDLENDIQRAIDQRKSAAQQQSAADASKSERVDEALRTANAEIQRMLADGRTELRRHGVDAVRLKRLRRPLLPSSTPRFTTWVEPAVWLLIAAPKARQYVRSLGLTDENPPRLVEIPSYPAPMRPGESFERKQAEFTDKSPDGRWPIAPGKTTYSLSNCDLSGVPYFRASSGNKDDPPTWLPFRDWLVNRVAGLVVDAS